MIDKRLTKINKTITLLIVFLLLSSSVAFSNSSEICDHQHLLMPGSGFNPILDTNIGERFRADVVFKTLVEVMDKILAWPNIVNSEIGAIKSAVMMQVPGIDIDIFRVDLMNKSEEGVLFLPFFQNDTEKSFVLRFYPRGVDPDENRIGIMDVVLGRLHTGNDRIICDVVQPKLVGLTSIKRGAERSSPVNSEEIMPLMRSYLEQTTEYLASIKACIKLMKNDPVKYGNEIIEKADLMMKRCYECEIPEIRSILSHNIVNKSMGFVGFLRRDLTKIGMVSEKTLEMFPEMEEAIEICKKDIQEVIDRKKDAMYPQGFIEVIREKALKTFLMGQKIVIGIDESWIPDIQKNSMQELLPELQRISSKSGFENIIFVRENGTELAQELEKIIENENVNLSGVIILGGVDVLRSKKFENFKTSSEQEGGAFFIEIIMQERSRGYGYIKLLDMIKFSIRAALDGDVSQKNPYINIIHVGRKFILLSPIPDISVEINQLREVYDTQAKAIASMG